MQKVDSSLVRQKNRGSSQACCPKAKKKAPTRINLIKQEVDDHSSRLTKLKAKIGDLIQEALDELQKVREKSNARLPENPAQEEAVGGDKSQDGRVINPLDIEIEKLQSIRRWLGEPPATIPEQRELAISPDVRAAPRQNILIVDDDPTTVRILTHFLEREKYVVTSSQSGAEGLEKASREKPGLILLDIMIPDLNGFQFLSLLRKNKDLASVPVILLSMLAQESDILKGLEIGAVDYVTKPFSPPILLAKIKKHMRQEK